MSSHLGTAQLCKAHALEAAPVRHAFAKRALDIFVSIILLAVFFPVFLVLIVLVKMTSNGPIFYKSRRVGLLGHEFSFLKFRSMYVDADRRLDELKTENEKDGPIFKIKNDPRITPLGRWMRKYSLDELPQLLHVLTGEMTLVGPRPAIPKEVAEYDLFAMKRLTVKPGITCYWQVMGRSDLSFQEWMELDNRYISEMSFWLDLWILLRTPAAIFLGKGAY